MDRGRDHLSRVIVFRRPMHEVASLLVRHLTPLCTSLVKATMLHTAIEAILTVLPSELGLASHDRITT